MKQLAVAFAVVVGVMFVGAGVTQAYPPGSGTVTVSNSTPTAGDQFTVTYNNCQIGEPVTFRFNGGPPVTVITTGSSATGSGSASTVFTAPGIGGTYSGTATCLGTAVPFTITVQDPPVVTIPKTGSDGVGRNLSIGLGLLGLGGALLVVAQLRRRTPATA